MEKKKLTRANGAPVADNNNVSTAGSEDQCYCMTYGFLKN